MSKSQAGIEFAERLRRGGEQSRMILKMLEQEHPEFFEQEDTSYPKDPDEMVYIYRMADESNPYKGIFPVKKLTRREMEILTPDPERTFEGLRHQFETALDYNRGNDSGKVMVLVEEGMGSDRRYRLTTVRADNADWKKGKAENENKSI